MELKKIITVIAFAGTSYIALGQTEGVSIKSSVSPPHPSAMLDVESSSKGLLVPRVSLSSTAVASPISNPAPSLLVYNTATTGTWPTNVVPGYYYWDDVAGKWRKLVAEEAGTSQGGVTPVGGIIMWSGSPSQIPTGWLLCNGQGIPSGSPLSIILSPATVVPNLKGKFIVGYDAGDTDYTMNKIGPDNPNTTDYELVDGKKRVKMLEPAMPAHTHPGPKQVNGSTVTAKGSTGAGDPHSHGPMADVTLAIGTHYDSRGTGYSALKQGSVPIPPESAHKHTIDGPLTLTGTLNMDIPSDGNGHAVENRPPYYTLAYIIRVY